MGRALPVMLSPIKHCALAFLAAWPLAAAAPASPPFGPGEELTLRITYARLLAGRAHLRVLEGRHQGSPVLRYVAEARSEGFFAWLFRFRVRDRTVAVWDPVSGCSLGIAKHLSEGRASRDQLVRIDPWAGTAEVEDRKVEGRFFEIGRCTLDVLSALFVVRLRGLTDIDSVALPLFDNGKRYELGFRLHGRERLDLPSPLGAQVPTMIVEPLLLEGTGLFVKKGRLKVWLTDDERRIPVRLRTKVAIGSVSADLESYTPPTALRAGGPERDGPPLVEELAARRWN